MKKSKYLSSLFVGCVAQIYSVYRYYFISPSNLSAYIGRTTGKNEWNKNPFSVFSSNYVKSKPWKECNSINFFTWTITSNPLKHISSMNPMMLQAFMH